MTSKKVIIIGGMGNGSVIASAIKDANQRGDMEWVFSGYLNDRENVGSLIDELPVLGKISDYKSFLEQGYFFINTIFKIDGQQERIDLFTSLEIPDDKMAIFIHPTAYVPANVNLGPGSVVMPNVSLSSGTTFGKCNLIMVNAIIGHNNTIGDYCHFAAQCCVGAYLKIENGVHVGLNATIREDLTIGKNSTIGMGSVLLKNVGEGEIWAGVPAKLLRKAL